MESSRLGGFGFIQVEHAELDEPVGLFDLLDPADPHEIFKPDMIHVIQQNQRIYSILLSQLVLFDPIG